MKWGERTRSEVTSYNVQQGKGNLKEGVAIEERGMVVKDKETMVMEDRNLRAWRDVNAKNSLAKNDGWC